MEIIIVRYVRDDNFAEPMVRSFASPHTAYVFVQDLERDPSVLSIESHCDTVDDFDIYAQ